MKQKAKYKETKIGRISEDWGVYPFSQVVAVNPIRKLKKAVIAKKVSMQNLQEFRRKISGYDVAEFKGGAKFKNDDTLMARITPCLENGKTSYVDILDNDEVGFGSTEFNVFCGKDGKTTDKFVYYLVVSPTVRAEAINSMVGTSGRQRVQSDIFDSILIPLPSIIEQEAIAKVLSDLDSKIELNIAMNKTLEAIGHALFKRWFVDFEFPNEKGKPYKSSGGEMIESELGKIPRGWTINRLKDSGTFKNGINYLKDETGDTDFFIANVRDIANNKLLLKESLDKIKINLSKAKEYLLQEKDILIARSASPGEISLVLGDLEKVIYSGFSIRYRLNNSTNYLYIYHVMIGLKRNLQNYSIGTTLQSVNQETLKNMKFILPSDKILGEFNKITEQLLGKTSNNLIQNRDLSQIRDLLLPRLMSGKIRIN